MKYVYLFMVLTSLANNVSSTNWNSLSPKQQQLLVPFASDWSTLDEDTQSFLARKTNLWVKKPKNERQRIRQILNRFKNKNSQQRKVILNKYMRFESLPPAKRKQIRQAQRRFKNLTPKQKEQLRQKYNRMNPKQKRQILTNEKFRTFINQFDENKQVPLRIMFKSLLPRHKRAIRLHIKQLSHQEKHEFTLYLLAMNPTERLSFLDSLLNKQQ
jgi:hypothetical protein